MLAERTLIVGREAGRWEYSGKKQCCCAVVVAPRLETLLQRNHIHPTSHPTTQGRSLTMDQHTHMSTERVF